MTRPVRPTRLVSTRLVSTRLLSTRLVSTRLLSALGLGACAALLCSCTGGSSDAGPVHSDAGSHTTPESAGSVTSRLGAVPIPSAPPEQPTPVASFRHPQLLAMGEPLEVVLPAATATITTFGPYERTPYTGGTVLPTSTVGTITVEARPTSGRLTLRAADFLSRDETGHVVSLSPVGPASLTATPTHPVTLRIRGTFDSGAAQVTWRYQHVVVAIWDFNVELD